MNILVACNEKYLRLAKYMLFSLHKHNGFLNVYLIHENVSNASLDDLSLFFKKHSIGELNIINFDSSTIVLPLKDDKITGHITKEAYFRLYAPFFLPDDMERILYLDCDIICTGDISEFYNIDFDENVLVGCKNTDLDNSLYIERLQLPSDFIYINSGVLLFNLEEYRKCTSIDSLNRFICENALILDFQDQDVINKMFCGKIKYGRVYYNFQIGMLLYTEGGILVHYTGPVKPWYDEFNRPILAQPYYDTLYELGELEELKRIKKIHYDNFKNGQKLISALITGDVVTDDLICDVISQLENRVEFIISYNSIEDGLIEKYKDIDCRLFFVKNDDLTDYYSNLLGMYYVYFKLEDFKDMDANFIRELGYFIDNSELCIVFYNTYSEEASNRIISVPEGIDEDMAISLMNENEANGYNCIHMNSFNRNLCNKYGYWENNV